MIENAFEVEILQDMVELKIPMTTAMLLTEARRRGLLRIRCGGLIYTIRAEETDHE